MNVDDVGFHDGPADLDVVGDFLAPDEVGRVIDQPEFRRIDSLYQVNAIFRRVAVNVGFVLVHHRDIHIGQHLDLRRHSFYNLLAVIVDILALGRVVAEHSYVRRLEEHRQVHRVLELVQVRLERLVQLYLADGRTDGADFQAVVSYYSPRVF